MALLPTDQKGQVMALLAVLALAGVYAVWTYVVSPDRAKVTAVQTETDSLQRIVDAAKADLAQGTVEDLRRNVAAYAASLELARRLVPERNEVPALIDDISTRSKIREVTLGTMQPLAPSPGRRSTRIACGRGVRALRRDREFLSGHRQPRADHGPGGPPAQTRQPSLAAAAGRHLGSLLVANFTIKTYVRARRRRWEARMRRTSVAATALTLVCAAVAAAAARRPARQRSRVSSAAETGARSVRLRRRRARSVHVADQVGRCAAADQ
jgi:hypothetical protein